MHVDIGGVHLWDANTWADLGNVTWNSLGSVVWSSLFNLHDQRVLDGQCSIHHRIEERSTAEIQVYDPLAAYNFQVGQEVKIFDNDFSLLYGGVVTESVMTLQTKDATPVKFHSVRSSDYHAVAEDRIFNKAYITPQANTIIYDILLILAEEGITEGEIQAGDLLQDQLFSYVSCAEALDKVAGLCAYTWWISEDKKLYFVSYTTYAAAWSITDGHEILLDSLDISAVNDDYRNIQWVSGGKAITVAITEPIKGNGTTKSFPLGFPLAKEPVITINSVPAVVGIKGVETGKEWYWNEGDNTIYQDEDEAALVAGDAATVTYYGEYKLIAKVQAAAEISRNRLVRGFGSGKVENMHIDASILNVNSAIDVGTAKLANYARAGRLLHYKTNYGKPLDDTTYDPLICGTLQTITLPYFSVTAAQFLVISADIEFIEGRSIWSYELAEGPVDPSWTKIFCQLANNTRALSLQNASESDTVQGVYTFTKTWAASTHPNPFISELEAATPADVDFPCLDLTDRFSYVVLYSYGIEFFRKAVAEVIDTSSTQIDTIALILSTEANGTPISHVGLWGGIEATTTAGTGIEMEKWPFSYTKTYLESLQFNFSDIRGW